MEKKSLIGKNNLVLTLVISTISILLIFYFILSNSNTEKQQIAIVPSQSEKVKNVVPHPIKTGKVSGQLSIKFKPGLTQQQITQELQKYNAQIIRQIPAINRTIVQVPAGQETQIVQQLSQDAMIQNAESSYYQHVLFVPNDPSFKNQWYLNNTGQVINNNVGTAHADINAEPAWDISKGSGVKVAILDTGLDMSHQDIASKVIAQKVFVTSSIDDRYGHGTHVAGILAANTNNGQGIAGVCPDCQLIIGKAMDDQGQGDTSVISAAITWAADSGAKVINLSEGGDILTQTQQDAVNYAINKGAVVVAAAGNNQSNQKFYPAAMSQVLSVAAVDNTDQFASTFSNYGTWVSVAAPGQDIYSTLPTKNYAMQNIETLQLNYDYLSGTSMAAPVVSGVAALVWASPYGTSNTAVIQRIESTADKIAGTGTDWQYGRVNAAKAVGATATATPTPTKTTPTSTPTPTQVQIPTSTPVVPSYVCGGSTNSVCPTLTPTPGNNTQPTVTLNPTEIALSGMQPTSSVTNTTPSTAPCTTTSGVTSTTQSVTDIQEVAKKKKHHKHHKRKKGESKQTQDGLLKQMLDLLKQFLELINQLMNNGGGTTTPCPTPTPATTEVPTPSSSSSAATTTTPTPSSTISQQPTSTPSASTLPTATSVPSKVPTATPTTTISSAPTATPIPSSILSETPTSILTPTTTVSNTPSQALTVTPSTTPNNNNFATQILKFLLDFINLIINFFTSLFK